MPWASNVFPLLIVTASGGFTGLFVYSPGPGHNNLIASITAQAGTDPYGNAYLQGITSYQPGVAFSQLLAGAVQLGLTGINTAPAALTTSGSVGSNAQLFIHGGHAGEAGARESQVILNDSGTTGGVQTIDGHDGNTYDIERLTLVSPGVTITSSTAPGTTIFTHAIGVGTYEIEVWLVTQNTTAADNAIFQFSGVTAGAPTLVDGQITSGTAPAVVNYFASATFSTAFSGQAVAGNQRVHALLTLTTAAAGTLLFSGRESVAGNTVTVSAGSRMRICPVVAT